MYCMRLLRRLPLAFIMVIAMGAVLVLGAPARSAPPAPGEPGESGVWAKISGIRHGIWSDRDRLVIDLDRRPDFAVYQLSSPQRVVVDFFAAIPDEKLCGSHWVGTPLVSRWTLTRPTFHHVRLVVDLRYPIPPEQVHGFALASPHRLVLDLSGVYRNDEQITLSSHLTWKRTEMGTSSGYYLVNELHYLPGPGGGRVAPLLANDDPKAREFTSRMVARSGAIAGVNGGFFASRGGTLGLVVIDGKMLCPPVDFRPPRTIIAQDRQGRFFIDRARLNQGILLGADGQPLPDLAWALGGGPQLLAGGRVAVTADQEALGPRGNDITRRAGRTAVGIKDDGSLALFTISGPVNNGRQGMSLEEAAGLLRTRGVVRAMNLDGGNSTTMSIGSVLVSRPPLGQGPERKVGNGLFIFDPEAQLGPAQVEIIEPGSSALPPPSPSPAAPCSSPPATQTDSGPGLNQGGDSGNDTADRNGDGDDRPPDDEPEDNLPPPAVIRDYTGLGPLTMRADGRSSISLRVMVRDGKGQPVADGTPVRFIAGLGETDPSRALTTGGIAQTTLRSVRRCGAARVTVISGTSGACLWINFVPGSPALVLARVINTADRPQSGRDVLQQSALLLEVLVLDDAGLPVPGVSAHMVCLRGDTPDGAEDCLTDAQGTARFPLAADTVGAPAMVTVQGAPPLEFTITTAAVEGRR